MKKKRNIGIDITMKWIGVIYGSCILFDVSDMYIFSTEFMK